MHVYAHRVSSSTTGQIKFTSVLNLITTPSWSRDAIACSQCRESKLSSVPCNSLQLAGGGLKSWLAAAFNHVWKQQQCWRQKLRTLNWIKPQIRTPLPCRGGTWMPGCMAEDEALKKEFNLDCTKRQGRPSHERKVHLGFTCSCDVYVAYTYSGT